jgi:eukaryotic-like serine/threonine-protein kinase
MNEREIFVTAYQKADPAERQRFLDEACGGDAALRQRVDALLALADNAGSFLEQSPVADQRTGGWEAAPGSTAPVADEPLTPGTVIGPYKLLELIGEGGMGAVFMSQQTHPVQRKVALKIIKPGMDSRQVVARFEAERQALALMDHPNIAKVFDAGSTSTGRRYFVMELVKGVPITQYCDDHHLTPKQRLELFVSVCQAVQHAHQKGIIHRDIKPSNVLVAPYDGKPVVKVIDFGIAKATGQQLTAKTLFTGIGAVVGTPEYMSPEQAELNNQDIDTRSDIYSLGVLLYELLTGTTPLTRKRLKEAALLEVLRLVREEEPPRPSTRLSSTDELPTVAANRGLEPRRLTGLVRGDLDLVVMKSLDKNRNRRYETANGFAQDVQRYLNDEPVQARPPSALYRFSKFARRNRAAVAVVAVASLALAVTVGVLVASGLRVRQEERAKLQVVSENLRKEEQRADAEARRADAEGERARTLDRWRQTAHYLRLGFVQNEYRANRLTAADELLDGCEPNLRHWEWYYLKRLCHSATNRVLVGLPRMFGDDSAVFSPDARRVALNEKETIRVCETASGKEIRSFTDRELMVRGMALSPDGKLLALGGAGGGSALVKVREIDSGKEIAVLKGPNEFRPLTEVAFSPSGKRVAGADGRGNVAVWDRAAGERLMAVSAHVYPNAPPNGFWSTRVAFNDDGSQLWTASGGDTVVKVWDVQTGKAVQSAGPITGHTQAYLGPKRMLLVTTGQAYSRQPELTIRVWDTKTGRLRQVFPGHSKPVNCVAFSTDERLLATGSWDNSVIVWDVATGAAVSTFRGGAFQDSGPSGVAGVAFTPDNKRVLAVSKDGALRTWEVAHPPEAITLRARVVLAGAFSPDGRHVATSAVLSRVKDRSPVVIWDTVTGEEVKTLGEESETSYYVTYSPDGRYLAAAMVKNNIGDDTGLVRVWDVATGKTVRVFPGKGEKPIGPCIVVAYSPDGRLLTAAGGDRVVHVWDTATGAETFALKGHPATVSGLAFSANGRRLASGTGGFHFQSDNTPRDNDVKVWDLASGTEVFGLTIPRGEGLALSRDGTIVTFSAAGGYQRREVATGKEIGFTSGRSPQGQFLAQSPDGKRFVTGYGPNELVKLWDSQTGEEILTLGRLFGWVTIVAFSPDGNRIMATGQLGEIKIWEGTPPSKLTAPGK